MAPLLNGHSGSGKGLSWDGKRIMLGLYKEPSSRESGGAERGEVRQKSPTVATLWEWD